MPRVSFDALPGHGRLWVFPLTEAVGAEAIQRAEGGVDAFLDQWAAHGAPLRSARRWVDERFLLVGVDVDSEMPSGCSIDALTGQLRTLGSELGSNFVDHSPVWFRSADGVRCVSRPSFKQLAAAGEVGPETPVFDTSITRVDEAASLEREARDSWHGRAFFKAALSG